MIIFTQVRLQMVRACFRVQVSLTVRVSLSVRKLAINQHYISSQSVRLYLDLSIRYRDCEHSNLSIIHRAIFRVVLL